MVSIVQLTRTLGTHLLALCGLVDQAHVFRGTISDIVPAAQVEVDGKIECVEYLNRLRTSVATPF